MKSLFELFIDLSCWILLVEVMYERFIVASLWALIEVFCRNIYCFHIVAWDSNNVFFVNFFFFEIPL